MHILRYPPPQSGTWLVNICFAVFIAVFLHFEVLKSCWPQRRLRRSRLTEALTATINAPQLWAVPCALLCVRVQKSVLCVPIVMEYVGIPWHRLLVPSPSPLSSILSLHDKVSPTSPQEAQTTVVHSPADGTKVSRSFPDTSVQMKNEDFL